MNKQQNERPHAWHVAGHRAAEMLLFLVASAVGTYSLGQALGGLFEPDKGISIPWLIVTGMVLMILSAQMGRVQASWPHRQGKEPKPE